MEGGGKRLLSSVFLLQLKCDSRETMRRYGIPFSVYLPVDGGRFGSPSCFPPGYDQRDGPLVSYWTRSGWPYNRTNELIGRRDRHASWAFFLTLFGFTFLEDRRSNKHSMILDVLHCISLSPDYGYGELGMCAFKVTYCTFSILGCYIGVKVRQQQRRIRRGRITPSIADLQNALLLGGLVKLLGKMYAPGDHSYMPYQIPQPQTTDHNLNLASNTLHCTTKSFHSENLQKDHYSPQNLN
ncbi:hypothetical protein PIB30_030261 [Stylosanthes scabra]|uniref:Uncharacterized protein n=1 Tax=Stylosanthes scabra TaxID=79078 RepID=A0ABU6Y8U4_9FABA|nr:hypothetical protein [Stylosanthes scabra]